MQKHLVLGAAACIALVVTSSAAAQAPAGTATATYNRVTGNMVFDVGSGLALVGVESIGNVILGLPISPEPSFYTANEIAFFKASGLTPGQYNLGNAFKTGLTADLFLFAHIPIGLEIDYSQVRVVPEPVSVALVGSGLCVVLAARRRALKLRSRAESSHILSTAPKPTTTFRLSHKGKSL